MISINQIYNVNLYSDYTQGMIGNFHLTIINIHISKLMYFNVPGHDGTIRSERRIVFVRLIKDISLGFQRKLPEKFENRH